MNLKKMLIVVILLSSLVFVSSCLDSQKHQNVPDPNIPEYGNEDRIQMEPNLAPEPEPEPVDESFPILVGKYTLADVVDEFGIPDKKLGGDSVRPNILYCYDYPYYQYYDMTILFEDDLSKKAGKRLVEEVKIFFDLVTWREDKGIHYTGSPYYEFKYCSYFLTNKIATSWPDDIFSKKPIGWDSSKTGNYNYHPELALIWKQDNHVVIGTCVVGHEFDNTLWETETKLNYETGDKIDIVNLKRTDNYSDFHVFRYYQGEDTECWSFLLDDYEYFMRF